MTNQEILDNAPEGATHIDSYGNYWTIQPYKRAVFNLDADIDALNITSSLSDLRKIVELEKKQQAALSAKASAQILSQIYLNMLDNEIPEGDKVVGSDWDYITDEQYETVKRFIARLKADAVMEAAIATDEVYAEGRFCPYENLTNYANKIYNGEK